MKEIDLRNSSINNEFGLSPYNRIKAIETGLLLSQVEDKNWSDCNDSVTRSFLKTLPIFKVKNMTKLNSICGIVIIQRKEPIPWAWWRVNENVIMNSKIIQVYVECDK